MPQEYSIHSSNRLSIAPLGLLRVSSECSQKLISQVLCKSSETWHNDFRREYRRSL
jgi:hypothetical protein